MSLAQMTWRARIVINPREIFEWCLVLQDVDFDTESQKISKKDPRYELKRSILVVHRVGVFVVLKDHGLGFGSFKRISKAFDLVREHALAVAISTREIIESE